jgi:SAM-dependent methyltransferase
MPAMIDASAWVQRHLPPVSQSSATLLDVAAGGGRHTRYALTLGYDVVAVDRDVSALALEGGRARIVQADIEACAWPFREQRFDVVLVTNYLHRSLLPTLYEAVAEGGRLIYETFAVGQERFGRPTRADFLLRPNELLQCVDAGFTVLAYEHGVVTHADGRAAMVQALCAHRGQV